MNRHLVAILFTLLALKAPAQKGAFFTSGTEFLVPNMGIYQTRQFKLAQGQDTGAAHLLVTSAQPTCFKVDMPARNFFQTYNLAKDSSKLIKLPDVRITLDSNTNNTSIHIIATAPIQVQYLTGHNLLDSTKHKAIDPNLRPASEMAAITPTHRATNNYTLNCVNDSNYALWDAKHHWFWVQGIDSNEVDIETYAFSFYGIYPPNVPYSQSLLPHEMYSNAIPGGTLGNPQPSRGYAGSLFSAPKPFLLFAGNWHYQTGTCFNPSTTNYGMAYADMYEQSKPPQWADTLFFAAQLNNHYENLYSILALEDSTLIYFNNQPFKTVKAGFQLDTCFGQDVVISSTKPILASLSSAVIGDGNDSLDFPNSSASSAFTITLPGSKELVKRSIVTPLKEKFSNTNTVMLFTLAADTNLLTHNGQVLPSGSWQVFAARPNWAYAQIEITLGTNIFESAGSGFNGYWYNYVKRSPGLWYMPSNGTALTESVIWPQDSFVFQAGLTPNNLTSFSSFNPTLCPGQPLYLQASHLRHTTWQWAFGDGTTQTQRIGNQRAKPISHTWPNPGQYWLTVTDSAGCSVGDSLLVVVENGPAAAFSYTTNTGCSGTFVQLQNESMGAT
jgi:hypothetical protein